MKKSRLLLIIIATFMFPSIVNASSIAINCNNVTVGESARCVIQGSSPALQDIEGKISVTGPASITSVSQGSGFTPMENNYSAKSASFAYITERDKTGSFTIATINLSTEGTGTATIRLSGIQATVSDGSISSTSSTSFLIKEKPTTATTTTTKKVTTTTTRKNNNVNPTKGTTPTTALITTPILEPLKLTSVTVDDFEVTYNNGVYYATTESYTESVTISATSTEGVTIVGTGVRKLSPGRNVVELVLRNLTTAQVNTYQVIITRPDDTANHDTKLTGLKVVNYGFAFSPDTYEYTIKIPYDVEEIYIIGETLNDDVNIAGVGLKSLTKGNNKIYIKVSYGNTESTDYVINIKRSYTKMILIIISIILGIGLIGAIVYALINRKAAMEARIDKKNREMAEMNRQVNATTASIQVNGQNVVGVGRKTVIPTKVVNVKTPSAQTGPGITKTVVTQNMGPRVQVVRTNPQGYENKMVIDNLEDK